MLPDKRMPCFPIFEDNQGAVQLSQNPVSNSNSKHIDVHHHFEREHVRQGDISVNHVSPEYQSTRDGMLQEPLCDVGIKHVRFSVRIHLSQIPPFCVTTILRLTPHVGLELTRHGTTVKPVSRDQILRREREHGESRYSASADHEQDR